MTPVECDSFVVASNLKDDGPLRSVESYRIVASWRSEEAAERYLVCDARKAYERKREERGPEGETNTCWMGGRVIVGFDRTRSWKMKLGIGAPTTPSVEITLLVSEASG